MRILCLCLLLAACGGFDANSVSSQHETGAAGIVNGGFESGDLTGWNPYKWDGVVAITSDAHSGKYALQLGTPDRQSGGSEADQWFTVPKGHPQLSFWYRGHCQYQPSTGGVGLIGPNGASYGLQATTYGYSSCAADSGWTQVTWDLTPAAGQQVTLVLTNNDYGTAGVIAGGSWFEVDDVELSGGAPAPAIANGGFESGDLTGWTPYGGTGTYQGITSDAHSGKYALQLGVPGHPTGYSGVEQDFTMPGGKSTLSFWYRPHCMHESSSGTIGLYGTYDGQTYGLVSTHDAARCATDGGWTHVSWDVSAAAGQKVALRIMNVDVATNVSNGSWLEADDFELSGGAPPPAVVNGGFESGMDGWQVAGGTVTVTSHDSHSGGHALQLGSSDPTSTSEAVQVFDVPANSATLTFWMKMHCPDTVAYDWAQVVLHDYAADTNTTILDKTCTDDGWKRVTVDISASAGHRVELGLINQDDNWAGDATFTLFDDVSVQ